jgi:hypothetical protein
MDKRYADTTHEAVARVGSTLSPWRSRRIAGHQPQERASTGSTRTLDR